MTNEQAVLVEVLDDRHVRRYDKIRVLFWYLFRMRLFRLFVWERDQGKTVRASIHSALTKDQTMR